MADVKRLAEQRYEFDLRNRLLHRRHQLPPESESTVVGNRSSIGKHDRETAVGRTRKWATLVSCNTSQDKNKAKPQGSCSFEGPKPLSEFLKRKRKEQEAGAPGDGHCVFANETKRQFKRGNQIAENSSVMPSECQEDDEISISKQEEEERQEEGMVSSEKIDELTKQGQISVPEMKGVETVSECKVEADNQTPTSTKEGLISEESAKLLDQGQPSVLSRSEVEEDVMMVIDKMELLHLQTFYKQGDGNDSEQVDVVGDFASEEAEYSDDEDDFAKKIAAMCGLPLLPCSN